MPRRTPFYTIFGMAKPGVLVAVCVWVTAACALQHFTHPVLASSPHAASLLSLLQLCACACVHVALTVLLQPGSQARCNALGALFTRPDRFVLATTVCLLVGTFCTNASATASTLFAAQCIRAMEPAIGAVCALRRGRNAAAVSRVRVINRRESHRWASDCLFLL